MRKSIVLALILLMPSVQRAFAQGNDNTSFNTVVAAYFNLKNALTMNNVDSVKAMAGILVNRIDQVPRERFSMDKYKVWMRYRDKLSYDAIQISNSFDITHQREHFVSLSENLYEVAKEFNTNTSAIYYQFCPMANDGKGAYWLSETKKIINPYFGTQMLSCGSTKKTIKPVK